jgi:hypothetical protein
MIAGAGEVAVIGGAFLIAMGRADAAVHVEHDCLGRMPPMHPINPLPRQIGQRGEVLVGGKELRLEAPHLAGGSGLLCNSVTADNPAHRRIASQAIGVVHVLVATEAAEDRLAEQARQRVPAVPAGARVNQFIAHHVRQPERVIEFAIGKQPGVGGDPGAMKRELQAAVEIKPQWRRPRFTRRVRHKSRLQSYTRH